MTAARKLDEGRTLTDADVDAIVDRLIARLSPAPEKPRREREPTAPAESEEVAETYRQRARNIARRMGLHVRTPK